MNHTLFSQHTRSTQAPVPSHLAIASNLAINLLCLNLTVVDLTGRISKTSSCHWHFRRNGEAIVAVSILSCTCSSMTTRVWL